MHRRHGAGGAARSAKVTRRPGSIAALHDRHATRLLLLLLGTDAVLVALHVVYYLTPYLDARFDLGQEGGWPECFGYLKYLTIAILFESVRRATRCHGYFAWTLVFVVLLADDALQVHETLGRLIAGHLGIEPPFKLRRQDLGELAAAAVLGGALLVPLAWAYRRGPQRFRKVSRDMLLLVALLVLCGVFADAAHMVAEDRSWLAGFLGIVEDGGELVAASLMLWYAFRLARRRGDPGLFLLDLVLAGASDVR